mmetsp:Transcript_72628/g.133034  ORF Transcript_72628/g.133034 Transcript_72628/m.133034 type:complete len:214 (+) Transcript_72628:74-715(+)
MGLNDPINESGGRVPPFLVKYPWIFYPIFLVIFMSPMNNGKPYKLILEHTFLRTLLYGGGVIMGFSYGIAGIILCVTKPFSTATAMAGSLQKCVYTTLLPVGLLMGLFHIYMMYTRLTQSTLGNAKTILACSLVQIVWLIIIFAWLKEVFTYIKAYDTAQVSALRISAGMVVFSSGIILTIMAARVFIFLSCSEDIGCFDDRYCGGGPLYIAS